MANVSPDAPPGTATTHVGHRPGASASGGAKRFYASIELDALLGLAQFKDINDNVIAHLVQKLGANVTVRLDIEATHPTGFDTSLQRTVRENANTLGFASASFEDE